MCVVTDQYVYAGEVLPALVVDELLPQTLCDEALQH